MKKILLLTLLAASLFQLTAKADGPKWFTANIQDANTLGTLLSAQLEDSETLASIEYLRLSGTLGTDDVTLIKNSLTGLLEIDMEGLTITSLPSDIFYNSNSSSGPHLILRRVVLPASLTTIGASAFYYCKALEEVVVPATLTTIGNSAFYGTTALTSFDFYNTQLSDVGRHAPNQAAAAVASAR